MAAFKHLSGGSGPGQKAEGCPGSARWPEIGTWGAARGKATPKPARPSGSPLPSSRPACPKPRAGCPPTLTPVYKHSPGAGWGGRDAGWRGGRGRWLRRTPPAARSEELVRESGPGSWKGLNALFLKLSILSTPIVRASCKTSQAF